MGTFVKAAPPKRGKQHHTKDRWNNTSSVAQRERGRQLHHPKKGALGTATLLYFTLLFFTFP